MDIQNELIEKALEFKSENKNTDKSKLVYGFAMTAINLKQESVKFEQDKYQEIYDNFCQAFLNKDVDQFMAYVQTYLNDYLNPYHLSVLICMKSIILN